MTECKTCGNAVVQPVTGRRRSYCSDACRIVARRTPRAVAGDAPGALWAAIGEALAKLPPGDDPRRRILAIELVCVAAEFDADPCGRPALIAVLERLVLSVFPADVSLVVDEMELADWWEAMGYQGRRRQR